MVAYPVEGGVGEDQVPLPLRILDAPLRQIAQNAGLDGTVVADEVRKLAERSDQAAKEIAKLIRESTQRVNEGTQLSDETGEALKAIIILAISSKILILGRLTRPSASASGRASGAAFWAVWS